MQDYDAVQSIKGMVGRWIAPGWRQSVFADVLTACALSDGHRVFDIRDLDATIGIRRRRIVFDWLEVDDCIERVDATKFMHFVRDVHPAGHT